ncbi:MAG: ABC transporter ATP-binding protein [Peptostreptococcaceae bacterium]
MSQLKLENINKKFDNKKILDNINLNIKEGEFVSLLGPSGCGKSTTLKIIAGLLEPDSGDIVFDNNSVLDLPTEKRGAVIVFQDYLLFPHLTVFDNIDFGLKMRKEKKNIRKEKVNKLIELVKLEGYENKYPEALSGGQKQRVAIARGLAIDPKILLLDEPFSNLDIKLRDDMREFVKEIQEELKITTILVTHDKEEALMMSDKVAIMLDGQIKQFDVPKELYQKPNCIEVANFFGDRNYLSGKIKDSTLYTSIGNFNLDNVADKENTKVMVSPENITIGNIGIEGIITKKKYGGDRTYYNVNIDGITLKVNSVDDSYEIHDKVKVNIDFKQSIYF